MRGLRRLAAAAIRSLVFSVSPAEAAIRVSPFLVYNDEITITGSMAILRSFG
jgi:hypothetical protein